MAGNDVFLWQVPSDANANDVRLRDPNFGVIGYTVTADAGAYVVTGSPVNVLRGYRLVAGSGSYAVTGQSANITRSRLLTAAAGAYSVTGQSTTILKSKVLQSASGAYVVSGNNANIVYTPASAGYTLTAGSGSYSVSGNSATITFTGGAQSNIGDVIVKRRVYIKRKDKILLFDSIDQADAFIDAEDTAEEQAKTKTSRLARKRVRDAVVAKFTPIVIDLQITKLLSDKFELNNVPELIREENWDRLVQIYELAIEMEEEENEALLFALP